MSAFPLWKAGRNYKGGSGAAVPARALAMALWLWHCGTSLQPSYAPSQCGSNLPLALLNIVKYELPDLTLALYNCCLAEYMWNVSRTRGEMEGRGEDFVCFSQDLSLAEYSIDQKDTKMPLCKTGFRARLPSRRKP